MLSEERLGVRRLQSVSHASSSTCKQLASTPAGRQHHRRYGSSALMKNHCTIGPSIRLLHSWRGAFITAAVKAAAVFGRCGGGLTGVNG